MNIMIPSLQASIFCVFPHWNAFLQQSHRTNASNRPTKSGGTVRLIIHNEANEIETHYNSPHTLTA